MSLNLNLVNKLMREEAVVLTIKLKKKKRKPKKMLNIVEIVILRVTVLS
jgi:hypothetical protein